MSFPVFAEPKKEKTDGAAAQNGALSPNGETPSHVTQPPGMDTPSGKPERPSSLGHGKLTRRLLCYHSEHCKFIRKKRRSLAYNLIKTSSLLMDFNM